jgi:hypothetical protein
MPAPATPTKIIGLAGSRPVSTAATATTAGVIATKTEVTEASCSETAVK